MGNEFTETGKIILSTGRDVFPVIVLILFFQLLILRQPILHKKRVAFGFLFCILGLALFLIGLDKALFPVGKMMAEQLSAPAFIFGSKSNTAEPVWWAYGWIYLFGGLIGFSTTIAEPALMAVAMKAEEVSRGSIKQWGLRIAVAVGVAGGIILGIFRIITGTPLLIYFAAGYFIVILQTIFAPRYIIPLAYDTGGVTTSTVTVPLVAALGLGLSSTIPGRNVALDGFGLVAFASVFPIITVLAYIQCAHWLDQRRT